MTKSKLKMIHIHHQNQPSKAICERMVISPEVIEKGVAYITATKIGKQKNQTKPLGQSITKVAQCGPKITDFSSVPNTKS